MIEVNFPNNIADELLKFAVIIAKTEGKWVFCRHRERDTYEVPGGHREPGETILETAKRELMEETGAVDFDYGFSGGKLDLSVHSAETVGRGKKQRIFIKAKEKRI